ncbi:phosphatidylcholine and lysophosphatidylcholine phospholipase [Dispira parvispora]|uniref:Lysophospholipase NTE1 n=1 Tax=Dispira parvispora TaxID=1520584 RepID=A0A9W8E200_9FUNG|nr:phosphatidylcholine and lysophosphatidylcholine phospholipase [Dispira parvispora]
MFAGILARALSAFDLHPDSFLDDDSTEGQPEPKLGGGFPHDFLSVFLSSIQIFGYLEQPVFRELARHLQTRRLLAGETMFCDDTHDQNFYIVVDGSVQVYLPLEDHPTSAAPYADQGEPPVATPWERRQRAEGIPSSTGLGITESWSTSPSGSPLTTGFSADNPSRTTDARYTPKEDLLAADQSPSRLQSPTAHLSPSVPHGCSSLPKLPDLVDPSTTSPLHFPATSEESYQGESDVGESHDEETASWTSQDSDASSEEDPFTHHQLLTEVKAGQILSSLFGILSLVTNNTSLRQSPPSTVNPSYKTDPVPLHRTCSPSLSVVDSFPVHDVFPNLNSEATARKSTLAQPLEMLRTHPSIIARATVDTTLAVLPAEAFHKLSHKFPKSTAHIVQVILTRLQRATFMILQNYFGVHHELHALERGVSHLCSSEVPSLLANSLSLNHLRTHFLQRRMPADLIPGDGFSKHSRVTPHATHHTPTACRRNFSFHRRCQNVESSPFSPHLPSPWGHGRVEKTSDEYPFPLPGVLNTPGGKVSTPHVEKESLTDRNDPLVLHRNTFAGKDDYAAVRDMVFESMCANLGLPADSTMNPPPFPSLPSISRRSSLSSRRSGHSPLSSRAPSQIHTGIQERSRVPARHSPTFIGSVQHGELSSTTSTALRRRSGRFVMAAPLPLPPPSNMQNEVELIYLPKGTQIIHQNERAPGLFYVIDGLLVAHTSVETRTSSGGNWEAHSNRTTQGSLGKSLFHIKPGGLAGYLGCVSDYPSFVHISAKSDTVVGFIPKKALDRMVDYYPSILLTLAKRIVSRLSPMVLYMDYALDWGQANPGQIVYREGAPADSIHVVLNGRLRAIRMKRKPTATSGFHIIREFGQGESIGEIEVLTDSVRYFTLHAIRDTEYVRLPKTLFYALAKRHPEVTFQISRVLAMRANNVLEHQLRDNVQSLDTLSFAPGALHSGSRYDTPPPPSPLGSLANFPITGLGKNNVNLRTIGILPVHRTVPVTDFAVRLHEALLAIGTTAALLNSTTVSSVLGKRSFSRMGKLKLMAWLAEQEQKYRLVLYVADSGASSSWTQQCIRQADCILLVGLGDGDPSIGEYERLLVSTKTTARKELILLHEARHCASGTSQRWLKSRLWIHAHHHVQMPSSRPILFNPSGVGGLALYPAGVDIRSALSTIKGRFKKYYSKFIPETPPTPSAYLGHRSDFSRLARRLCGQSVGLVLGGGGARGIAHLGVIRALEEAGIPIDMVGGTSIGAFMGGLYARDSDSWAILGWARMFSGRMTSVWRQLLDITYPVTSYVTGHEFNRTIWKVFGDNQIEDMWLPYFCITANITHSREEVHQTGYLWRYVRASMSLSGFLPPLCDNGHMLLDGGYLDNLPVQVMKSMGADVIFAIDVAADDDTSPMDFGDAVSGWRVLWSRWNPFGRTKIPNLAEIQSRLAYVSCVKLMEEAKQIPGCVYMKPPVQEFGVLQFGSFDDIFNAGYFYGKRCVETWTRQGLLDQWKYGGTQRKAEAVRLTRRNSV